MLKIIDISDNNPTPYDFHAVTASGVTGVMIKLSEGSNYRNELFDMSWTQAKLAGLVTGMYHFARSAGTDPVAQAQFFLSCMPKLGEGDIVALDMEDSNAYDNRGWWASQADWALKFLRTVQSAIGFVPLIYSYPAFIQACLQNTELIPYHLWLADLSANGLSSMYPWPSVTMRQFTWEARIAGIAGNLDMSSFGGTRQELMALGKPRLKPDYPYVTTTIARADMKAANHKTGKPDHTADDAVDEKHIKVIVEQGAEVMVTGDDIKTDDTWTPVHLPAPSLVHGWMLPKFLKPRS